MPTRKSKYTKRSARAEEPHELIERGRLVGLSVDGGRCAHPRQRERRMGRVDPTGGHGGDPVTPRAEAVSPPSPPCQKAEKLNQVDGSLRQCGSSRAT